MRVLLPVDEVVFGEDFEGVGKDGRSTMRGRPQADGLRAEHHRTVVTIVSLVIQRNVKGHRSEFLIDYMRVWGGPWEDAE